MPQSLAMTILICAEYSGYLGCLLALVFPATRSGEMMWAVPLLLFSCGLTFRTFRWEWERAMCFSGITLMWIIFLTERKFGVSILQEVAFAIGMAFWLTAALGACLMHPEHPGVELLKHVWKRRRKATRPASRQAA